MSPFCPFNFPICLLWRLFTFFGRYHRDVLFYLVCVCHNKIVPEIQLKPISNYVQNFSSLLVERRTNFNSTIDPNHIPLTQNPGPLTQNPGPLTRTQGCTGPLTQNPGILTQNPGPQTKTQATNPEPRTTSPALGHQEKLCITGVFLTERVVYLEFSIPTACNPHIHNQSLPVDLGLIIEY